MEVRPYRRFRARCAPESSVTGGQASRGYSLHTAWASWAPQELEPPRGLVLISGRCTHELGVQQRLRDIHCPPKMGIPVRTTFMCYRWNIQILYVLWRKIRQTWGGGRGGCNFKQRPEKALQERKGGFWAKTYICVLFMYIFIWKKKGKSEEWKRKLHAVKVVFWFPNSELSFLFPTPGVTSPPPFYTPHLESFFSNTERFEQFTAWGQSLNQWNVNWLVSLAPGYI